LLIHQRPSKNYTICNDFNLTVFNEPSNNNKITSNLNHHQSINKKIIFLYLFKKNYQNYQDNHYQVIPSLFIFLLFSLIWNTTNNQLQSRACDTLLQAKWVRISALSLCSKRKRPTCNWDTSQLGHRKWRELGKRRVKFKEDT
jgi:hypothetical protein